MFIPAISCLTTSNIPCLKDLTFQVPMQYSSLQHWSLLLPSDRHIHNLASFLLGLGLFIPSVAISLLFLSSILNTFQSGELIFQCHIFLPFHNVHGVLQAGYGLGPSLSAKIITGRASGDLMLMSIP